MSTDSKTQELIKKLQQDREKQAQLLEQLSFSLMIKEVWPEAFDAGRCYTIVLGSPDKLIFHIRRDDGEEKEFALRTVEKSKDGKPLKATHPDIPQPLIDRAMERVNLL